MPYSVTSITPIIGSALAGTALVGTSVPKYSAGVAQGLVRWIPTITVSTKDGGSAGAGKGAPIPLLVVTPVLLGHLTVTHGSQKLLGFLAPVFFSGLALGLTTVFGLMLTNTVHAAVGTGAGVATFRAPPATPQMVLGFKAAGMKGPATERHAIALGQALDRTFATLIVPVPIVGSASPVAAAGVGTGKIV